MEWEPKLQYSIAHLGYLLYMVRKTPNGAEFLQPDGKIIKGREGYEAKRPMWLARFENTEQLRQLIEQAEKQGVKAPTTERITGELEATKKHLFDMRAIVYKHEGLMFEADVKERPAPPVFNVGDAK